MEDKQLSEVESLQLIQEMINKAKNSVMDKGTWSIYWGAIILFCSLFTFAEITLNKWLPFNLFLITIPAMLVQIAVIYAGRAKKKAEGKPIGRSDGAIMYVWIAFTVSMLIIGFAPSHGDKATYLVLYGIPTFVTGSILKFRAMIIGGIICWACAILSSLLPDKYYLLLTALCALFAWLVPGIIMRRKYLSVKKKENV